jgi:hypothetical protein
MSDWWRFGPDVKAIGCRSRVRTWRDSDWCWGNKHHPLNAGAEDSAVNAANITSNAIIR